MTVLFRNLRAVGYVTVLLLAGGVLGIASYLASQFLPTIRFSFTTYSLVTPSFTIAVLVILLFGWSRPWIDALFLLTTSISWLALAAWARDINGPAECDALGSSRTHTVHGSIPSKAFCYESMILEAFSWSIFALLMFFPVACDYVGQQVSDPGMDADLERANYRLTLVRAVSWVSRVLPIFLLSGPSK